MDNTTITKHIIYNNIIIITKTKIYKNRNVKIVKTMSLSSYRKQENQKTFIKTTKTTKRKYNKMKNMNVDTDANDVDDDSNEMKKEDVNENEDEMKINDEEYYKRKRNKRKFEKKEND